MRLRRAFTRLAWTTAALAACSPPVGGSPGFDGGGDGGPTPSDGSPEARDDGGSPTSDGAPTPTPTPTPGGCREVDILFVIDDSGSMAEEQDNLARNFPEFIAALEAYETSDGGRLDYRVGVTSTSRGGLTFDTSITAKRGGRACTTTDECASGYACECLSEGFAPCSPGCAGSCYCEPPGTRVPGHQSCDGEDGVLAAMPGEPSPWIDGPGEEVAPAFSEAATLGVEGCGFEMPLYVVEHALSGAFQGAAGAPNAGFLRPDALLMIIILTDEDDCSSDANEIDQTRTMDVNHPLATPAFDYGCTDAAGNDVGEPYWPVTHYVDFLDDLMGMRTRWAAAVIAGMTDCHTEYGDAYTAHRLRRFVEAAGRNAILSDICAGDLASSMADALDTLQLACDDYPLI